MPVVPACSQDSASVACNYSWNLDYDFAAVHSPAAEVVHRSLVEEENHGGGRAPVAVGNRRDSHNYYMVAVPVFRNHSLPA